VWADVLALIIVLLIGGAVAILTVAALLHFFGD